MDNFIIKCDLVSGIFLVSGASDFGNMPSDIVSLAVSAGLGVSVLAGILSGVCYILTQKAQKPKRNRKHRREWYCDVCGTYLRSIKGILEGDRVVTCSKCQTRVCKGRCSRLKEEAEWICRNCLNTPESWFNTILSALQLYKTDAYPNTMNTDSLNELDEDIEKLRKKEKEQIRDFIEHLVNSLIGGNVDGASVSRIFKDKQYLPAQGQTPCTAHSALKKLIEKLIEESLTLPLLRKAQEHPTDPVDETDRTYEDLLATAIINKVITKAQNRLPNSSAASVSSRISSSSRRGDKEYFFGEETLDSKWKTTDFETTSFSSVEDWLHSDSSGVGSKKYVDRETLTIKHDIEISPSDSEEEEEDDTEYFRSRSSLLGDDEPNWFLQKRHFQTASPVPVPMLVPKPTAEAKVLIGDKEVDETSDLSDIASDYGDTEIVPRSQSILLESKTIIGGKNPVHNGSDGESSADSGVKEVDRDRSGYDQPDFVTKADITVDDDNVEDASILSVYSNTEKEAEYTERYASLPRTIVKTPTPPSRPSLNKDKQKGLTNLESSVDQPKNEKNHHVIEDMSYEIYENTDERNEVEDDDSVFEGSYSKKEKEKWKHAVQMENNPYSKENIEKRIHRNRSPFDTLFGPDYYARQASSPSGGKLKNMEDIEWANQKNNNDDSWVTVQNVSSEVPVEEPGLHEKPITQHIIPKLESNQDLSISEITSDSDSYINYYDVEKSQVYKKSSETTKNEVNNNEVILKETFNISPEKNNSQFTKVTSVATSRYTKNTNLVKKRHKSESDLLIEDSSNEPPKVLAKKKDNTLISKIYSQLHSRNFAVSSRKEVPAELTTRTSNNSRYNGTVALYNSEGEMSYDKKSFYGSSEELLEPAAKPQTFFRSTSAIIYNRSIRKSSISSEEDALSEHSLSSSKKKHIYSSSDDLFSIEEKEIPQKKKDNTLIDKIYQNLHVRNYALLNRDNIPIKVNTSTPFKNAYSSEDEMIKNEITSSVLEVSKRKKGPYGSNYDLHLASEIDFVDSNDERSNRSVTTPDPEIDEIAKKKIVHNLLDKFATLAPEVMPRRKFINTDQQELIDSETEMSISVKELRKKFENKNSRSEVNSSLTARSLSKKVRDELKH